MENGKSVLVTGGFGFVGGHLVRRLVEGGAEVWVLDCDTSPSRPSLLNLTGLRRHPRVHIINGDVTRPQDLAALIGEQRFDQIFHLAAYATVIERAVADPYQTILSNTLGLVNLLEAVRKARYEPERILFASTDKVYGDLAGEPFQEEITPLRGVGVYDAAKLAADLFARTYHDAYDLPVTVVRMCNLFGPYDFNTDHRLIPKAIRNLFAFAQPRPVELYAHARCHWRDYLYIEDAVRAFLMLAARPETSGEVFNLMGVRYLSTPDVLKQVVEAAAEHEERHDAARACAIRESGILIRPQDQTVGAIARQHMNGEKLHLATGFVPLYGFNEALRSTVTFYREYFRSTVHERRLAVG